jgi:hypothetical protein
VVSPNWLRLYAIAMPAIILFVRIMTTVRSHKSLVRILGTIAILLAIGQIYYSQFRNLTVGRLRGWTVATAKENYTKLRWINDNTSAGEFFFQAPWPGIYLPLQLRNPVFLDVASPFEPTRPEFVRSSVLQLETRRVRYILWAPSLSVRDPQRRYAYQLEPLRDLLLVRYTRTHVFPMAMRSGSESDSDNNCPISCAAESLFRRARPPWSPRKRRLAEAGVSAPGIFPPVITAMRRHQLSTTFPDLMKSPLPADR